MSCRKKFGSISDVQTFREAKNVVAAPSAPSTMESEPPSDARLNSSPVATRRHSMAVVDVRIPIHGAQLNEDGKSINYVLVTIPDKHKDEPRLLQPRQGQSGSFFSIHSTTQQPVSCSFDASQKRTKCCICCGYTSATFQEQWSPYKPGDNWYIFPCH